MAFNIDRALDFILEQLAEDYNAGARDIKLDGLLAKYLNVEKVNPDIDNRYRWVLDVILKYDLASYDAELGTIKPNYNTDEIRRMGGYLSYLRHREAKKEEKESARRLEKDYMENVIKQSKKANLIATIALGISIIAIIVTVYGYYSR